MSYTRNVVVSVGLLFVCLTIANVAGYLMRLVLARTLSPTEFGLLYAVFAIFGFVGFAQTLGMTDALAQRLPKVKDPAQIKTAFLTVVYTQLAVMAVVFVLAVLLAPWLARSYFHEPIAAMMVIIYGAAMVLSPIEVSLIALFQGIGKPTWYGYMALLRGIFLFLYTVLLLWFGMGIFAPVFAYLLVGLLVPIVYLPVVLRSVPGFSSIPARIDPVLRKEFIKFGLPIILAGTIGIFLTYIDTFFLTLLRSLEDVALYNIALPTASVFWFMSNAIYAVMLPVSSEMQAAKKLDLLHEGIGRMYVYLLIIALPFTAVLLLFPDIIINALFGGAYIGAAVALQLLAVGGVFYMLSNLNTSIIIGLGKSKIPVYALIVAAVVNVVLDIILIPSYGAAGSAAATLIAFIVLFVVNMRSLRSLVPFTVPYGRILLLMVATGLSTASLYYLRGHAQSALVVEVFSVGSLIGGIVYVGLLFALRIVTFAELKNLTKGVFK